MTCVYVCECVRTRVRVCVEAQLTPKHASEPIIANLVWFMSTYFKNQFLSYSATSRVFKGATFQRFHRKIIFTFDVSPLLAKCAAYNSFP